MKISNFFKSLKSLSNFVVVLFCGWLWLSPVPNDTVPSGLCSSGSTIERLRCGGAADNSNSNTNTNQRQTNVN